MCSKSCGISAPHHPKLALTHGLGAGSSSCYEYFDSRSLKSYLHLQCQSSIRLFLTTLNMTMYHSHSHLFAPERISVGLIICPLLQNSSSQLGVFCPPGDIWQCQKIFLVVSPGRGRRKASWHLMGRGQQGCQMFYSAQNNPTAEKCPARSVNSALAERPWGGMEAPRG